jgi:hypothetical protein
VGPTCQTTRAAPGLHGSAPLPRGCHVPRRSSALKALSGLRAGVPTLTPIARPHASPLAPPPRSHVARTVAMPPRSPHRSPVIIVPRRCPLAGEPPVSSAVSRAPVGCRRWAAVQRRRRAHHARVLAPCAVRCMGRPSWAAHAGRARAMRLGRARFRPSGTRIRFYIF